MKKILILFVLVLAVAGCKDDDPVVPSVPSPAPGPTTPQQLMADFQTIYEERNFDGYRAMLHPDYRTILQQETVDQFPDVGPTLDHAEELAILERMFSGDDLVDPEGAFVPGVVNISFARLAPLDDWTESPPDDMIPNALFAPYEVDVLFSRGQQYNRIHVQGIIRFYVEKMEGEYRGEPCEYYQMIGQVDLTSLAPKSTETDTWGSVKCLYRASAED